MYSVSVLQSLPSFGPYIKEKESIVARHKEKIDLLGKEFEPEKVRPALKPDKPAPLVKVIDLKVFFIHTFYHPLHVCLLT